MNDITGSGSGEPEVNLGRDMTTSPEGEPVPTTHFVCGRGRVGKTTFANTLVQFARQHGARIEVWNGDLQNKTHNLTIFHPDASCPTTDDPEEKRLWLENRLRRQAEERFDALLDMTGNDPLVRQLARDLSLVRVLARRGIRSVAWYALGPEPADLDYLKASMESGLFTPEATIMLFNSGLVTSGRAAQSAFADVARHPVVKQALAQGARILYFPRLICMSAVCEQGLTFEQAKSGLYKPGQVPLSFLDEARVEVFWDVEVPKFFSDVPRLWLPHMPGWSH